ncbi:MAG: hypothetical protein GY711_11210 [bacterium]|nr:hypothetical protein [bacterium]
MTTSDVTITATNIFDVEVELELASVTTPVTRCIRFMADDARASTSACRSPTTTRIVGPAGETFTQDNAPA